MALASLILAGGRSRRMGCPKEGLVIAGKTMLERTAETLLKCSNPVIVVRRDALQVLPATPGRVRIIDDNEPKLGPLMAIVTGMRHLLAVEKLRATDTLFVTGCDAPMLSKAAIDWLAAQIGNAQVAMPKVADKLQPLCAVYRLGVVDTMQALLDEGIRTPRTIAERATSCILDEARLATFDPTMEFLRSMNTPEEYAALKQQIEAGSP